MNCLFAVGTRFVLSALVCAGIGYAEGDGPTEPASVQGAVSCLAARILEKLPGGSGPVAVAVLPFQEVAGLDMPALQQLGQLLLSELSTQGAERLRLSSSNPASSGESTGTLPATQYWIEPGAAYGLSELILSAKIADRSGGLIQFAVCAAPAKVAEIRLFSQAASVVSGSSLKEVFRSQPLPFRALGVSARTSVDGSIEMALLGDRALFFFELRSEMLILKQSVDLPPETLRVRDLRGSVWIGVWGGKDLVLAQRSNDLSVLAFERGEAGWTPSVSTSFQGVPLSGFSDNLPLAACWVRGRNAFEVRPVGSNVASGQTQPAPSNARFFAAAVIGGEVPRLVMVDSHSRLLLSSADGSDEVRLPFESGDALVSLPPTALVVATRRAVRDADEDGLFAVDMGKGSIRFDRPTPGLRIEALCVEGTRIYAIARDLEGRSFLIAYEMSDG